MHFRRDMASSIGEDSPKSSEHEPERNQSRSNGSVVKVEDDIESQTSTSKAEEMTHTFSIGASVARPDESYPGSPTGKQHASRFSG